MKLFFDVIAIDLDGTLVDSVGDLSAAVNAMQESLGMPLSSELQVRNWVGNGIERLVHRALTNGMSENATVEQFTSAMPVFEEFYQSNNGTHSTLYPGVEAGLDWLASTGAPLCIVTNKARRFTMPLLKSLNILHRFEHCVAGDDVSAKKPDPAALFEVARLCDVKTSNALLIGDSISDIKAARAAGFYSLAVSYGYNHGQSVTELRDELQPDAIVDSFEELPDALAAIRQMG